MIVWAPEGRYSKTTPESVQSRNNAKLDKKTFTVIIINVFISWLTCNCGSADERCTGPMRLRAGAAKAGGVALSAGVKDPPHHVERSRA